MMKANDSQVFNYSVVTEENGNEIGAAARARAIVGPFVNSRSWKVRCSSILRATAWVAVVSLVAVLSLSCLAIAGGAQANDAPRDNIARGVVVEGVALLSEAEKAGLKEGDILLAWSRGDSKGAIESPFDLAEAEIEQAPLGKVALEGLRGNEKQVWLLGPDTWGVAARPNFSGDLAIAYFEGRNLAKAGRPPEALKAAARWEELAGVKSHSDAPWLSSWLFFHAAEALREAKQWKEADADYQSAIQSAPTSSPVIAAQLLRAWAKAYEQHNDWGSAEKYFQLAIEKEKSAGSGSLAIASNLDSLGNIWLKRGNIDKAEQYSREALGMKQKLAPDSLPVAASLHSMADVAYDRGDLEQAQSYHLQALQIRSRLAPNSVALAASYTSLGIVAWQRGDLATWDKNEHQALEIRSKAVPDSIYVAASLNNLGMIAAERGDFPKAEQYYHQALALKQKLAPESLSVAGGLINLGNVEGSRGDLDSAEQYYLAALKIQRKLAPESLNVAAILGNLGKLEQYRGNLEKAEQLYNQTLEIQQKLSPGSLRIATSLNDLGEIAESRGNLPAAVQYYDQSLAIRQKMAPKSLSTARTVHNLGNVARSSGDFAKAEQLYRQALALREEVAPGSTVCAESLAAVALVLRDQQHLESAAEFYEQAINALEKQTARLGGSEEVRSRFGAQHSNIYTDYVDLLLEQKQTSHAFEVLERSRARILLEMLASSHIDIHRGADPLLLAREQSLQESLAAKSDRRLRLLTEKDNGKQLEVLTKEIEDLEKQHQDVEEQLRRESPNYAALTQPRSFTLGEIQQLLDGNTVLIEYLLGEKRSYVFAVTSQSLAVHELPDRAEIERRARHLYEVLTARNRSVHGESEAARQLRIAKSDGDWLRAASALRVLVDPLTSDLMHKRLVVVSDGAVQYVPFAILPVPSDSVSRVSARTYEPLLAHHEIVELPSASVLAVLRREQRSQQQPVGRIAVLADPVFGANDARVKRKTGRAKPAVVADNSTRSSFSEISDRTTIGMLTRSMGDVGLTKDGGIQLSRLPFSRMEAASILALTPPGTGLKAVDFHANRALVMSGKLGGYRVVHFATHALVDDRHPELSGLVLSLVDESGNPQEGFVDLQDIYNLDLNAKLVVLSACDTALGEQFDGEGVIGLTRGFMYAGAQDVIGTLWKIGDLATAKFMKDFYKAMVRDRMSPAEALRQAQLISLKDKRLSSPYYWAAFTVQGDWR